MQPPIGSEVWGTSVAGPNYLMHLSLANSLSVSLSLGLGVLTPFMGSRRFVFIA